LPQKPTQETDDATKRSIIARRRHSQTLGAEIPSIDMSAGKLKRLDDVDNFFDFSSRGAKPIVATLWHLHVHYAAIPSRKYSKL